MLVFLLTRENNWRLLGPRGSTQKGRESLLLRGFVHARPDEEEWVHEARAWSKRDNLA